MTAPLTRSFIASFLASWRDLMLHSAWQPVGFHLGPDLRHIMPEHDDIVLFAGLVLHMVAQQRFGLEAEAFENRDGAGLINRHLHHQLFEAGTQSQGKDLLRQRPSDTL